MDIKSAQSLVKRVEPIKENAQGKLAGGFLVIDANKNSENQASFSKSANPTCTNASGCK